MNPRLLLLLFCSTLFFVGNAAPPNESATIILDVDASLYTLNIGAQKLAGLPCQIEGLIQNLGAEPITEFKVTWSDGDQIFEDHLTGLLIASSEEYAFSHSMPYLVKEGFQELTVSITDVNGQNDDDPSNNLQIIDLEGVTPAPNKVVLAELGTGTWCSWCPRGIVNMQNMYAQYSDYFVGVEIHKDDPMEDLNYREAFNAPTWPIARVDRHSGYLDPTEMEDYFISRIQQTPLATLVNGANYEASSRELQVSVSANFQVPLNGDYRLGLIILEDGVTGTDIEYGQANNYSGGEAGPMGGFENLPLYIFPEDMTYNNVGRAVFGGMEGIEGSLPTQVNSSQTYTYGFTYTIPEDFVFENLRLISVLVTPDGFVENAKPTTIQAAISQGYTSPNVSTNELISKDTYEVFPNPFQNDLQIQLDLDTPSELHLTLYNSLGQEIRRITDMNAFGTINQSFNTQDLDPGFYFLQIQIDDQQITEKLILERG